MKNIKAVIFDLDNTLVNRKEAFQNFCIYFINQYFQWPDLPDTIENMTAYMVLLDNNGYRDKYKFYETLIETWKMNGCTSQQLGDRHAQEFCGFTKPDTDMQIVLDYLAPKYKLAIITNGSSQTQNNKIDFIGIRDQFESVVVSGDVGIKKPDKGIFTLTCDSLHMRIKS